jgi:hypothetical protein
MGGIAPLIDAIHRCADQKVMRDKALAWCFDSEALRKESYQTGLNKVFNNCQNVDVKSVFHERQNSWSFSSSWDLILDGGGHP